MQVGGKGSRSMEIRIWFVEWGGGVVAFRTEMGAELIDLFCSGFFFLLIYFCSLSLSPSLSRTGKLKT